MLLAVQFTGVHSSASLIDDGTTREPKTEMAKVTVRVTSDGGVRYKLSRHLAPVISSQYSHCETLDISDGCTGKCWLGLGAISKNESNFIPLLFLSA